MTNGTACPDLFLLSQFLDGELEATAESQITNHVEQCSECRTQVNRLEHTDSVARAQLPVFQTRLSSSKSAPQCLSLERVVAYMQGLLTREEDFHIEQHLYSCDACLQEAKETSHVLVFLASLQEPSVPASLKVEVATGWENQPAEEHHLSLPRFVIKVTAQGLRLIESYLAPPLLDVQEVLVPLSAYRGEESSSGLSLRLNAEETEIAVLAVPEENGVAVTITLLGPERVALVDRRIFLRQQGKAIFSAQTDQRGVLRVPHLEPGNYEVACDEIHTSFQLELRP